MEIINSKKRKHFIQTEEVLQEKLKPLSRGQRKRHTKRQKYHKKQEMIHNSLKLHQKHKQSNRIDGLNEMKEQLTTLEKSIRKDIKIRNVPIIKSNKSKKYTTVQEIDNFNLVLQHPAFVKSPFEVIQKHLQNKLKEQAEELNRNAKELRKQESIKNKKKKEDKKKIRKNHLLEKSRKRKIGKRGNIRTSIH